MPTFKLISNAPSTLIYKGDASCPRTVIIQQLDTPDANQQTLWISSDRFSLDSAKIIATQAQTNGYLQFGVTPENNGNVSDFPSSLDFLTIPNCRSDIWARASHFVSGDPSVPPDDAGYSTVAVEAF